MYRKKRVDVSRLRVRSFNEDKPYDLFIREQLAATSWGLAMPRDFSSQGPHVPAGTVGFEPTAIRQARADRMDEILQTVGASMMGVTMGLLGVTTISSTRSRLRTITCCPRYFRT